MIYLDAGATTLQKPVTVRDAVASAVNTMTSPGRGSYSATHRAEETAYACRREAAELFEAEDLSQVVFTFNATHGLNIAVRSLIKPGNRVIITGYEHNAVTRILHSIPNVEIIVIDSPLFSPEAMLEQIYSAVDASVSAVIVNHVSNVFGSIAPVMEISQLCRDRQVHLIVDASQSAGILPVSMKKWGADFVAMPGHKGLYGPQGTGLLLCKQDTQPLLYGGTGTQSLLKDMPEELPDRLEAGTHNMPGIAGLLEGIRFVKKRSTQSILNHEKHLVMKAINELREIPGVNLFYEDSMENQTGVLSFIIEGYDCQELAEELARQGIALRAGLHCAPLAHITAKTLKTGTVRLSVSAFNTPGEIQLFSQRLKSVLREKFTF